MNGEDSQEVVPLPNIARASVDCGGAFLDSDPLDAFVAAIMSNALFRGLAVIGILKDLMS